MRRLPPPFIFWVLLTALGWPSVKAAAPAADTAPSAEESPNESEPADVTLASHLDAGLFWQAIQLLESKLPADQAIGRNILQQVSDHEYVHAQVLLGNCHLSGSYGFAKDARKAVNLFRLAAERGNAFAKVSLGSCYATGTGVKKDDAKAAEWLIAALASDADFSRPIPPEDFGNGRPGSEIAGELATDPVSGSLATAHFLLGQIETRRNNLAEAQKHYLAAATAGPDGRSGIYQAAVEAAVNFAFGKGTPRDPVKANEMIDQSRRLGARMGVSLIHNYVSLKMVDEFAVADLEQEMTEAGVGNQSALQLNIAQSLADKKSKDYNVAEAARWYELAAENGQAWAMVSLALIHARGELGQPDPGKAFYWFEKAGGGEKPKHLLATGNLIICLQQGFGVDKDEVRAAVLAKKHRSENILSYLASIGQAPKQVVSSEEEIKLNQFWARDKNDAAAQHLLALRYFVGAGLPANRAEGTRWLKKAAKSKNPEALCLLGWLYQFHPADYGFRDAAKAARASTECYKAAAEAGSIEGLANYANSLSTGFGVPQNEALAIATYEECLKRDPNHSRSHSNLGGIYNVKLIRAANEGVSFGTQEWKQKMLDHYEASERQEISFSAIPLGDLYYEGRFVTKDLGKAYGYFEQASGVQFYKAEAHYRLGFMHEFGQGVPVTYTEAAYHYRLAALEGHIVALRRLIDFYLTGTGVSLDFDRAAYWLSYMARLGQADALPTMADVLMRKEDYGAAVKLLKTLAGSPNPRISGYAHERLSRCYLAGSGVEKNLKRAEKHFKTAVEKDNGDALATLAGRQLEGGKTDEALATLRRAASSSERAAYALGQIYYFGDYGTQDRAAGLKYIQQSASLNNPDALYFLAGMTWNGEVDAPLIDEAIGYAQKAENLGNAKAAELREKLEKRRKAASDQPEENRRARAS